MVQVNGLSALNRCKGEVENNAEKDGLIIYVQI